MCLASQLHAGSVPEGIPRELARQRASEVSDIRYRLAYKLEPHASFTTGHEDVRFRWKAPLAAGAPLLIDFRVGTVSKLEINGISLPVTADNGHLLLPAHALRNGDNELALDFIAPVAPAGEAITLYEDKDDGSEYIYTLFVPMDASMAFPCFDQPDLKGRFTLTLTAPANWTVISNSAAERMEDEGAYKRTLFAETEPISTYLFAFAAGPFRSVHPAPGVPNVYVRQSQIARAEAEVPQIQDVTARGMQFLAGYFAQPFPFPKYEMVLLPGFAYGGMEHAGATFLNEDAMLFRTAPTDTDRFNRAITILHELAHQWFGDFTTMRWFDDLWLKEGFAQFMAYRAMAALAPDQNVWKRFYQSIKPAAYAIDVTQGTTPIYQDIPNLKDAKSAYGAIVYSKAPGLLKQLAYMLGDVPFRDGLRIYLREHAYSNAEWSDLVHAFERSSGQNLSEWASAWIRRRGMPQIRVTWSCDGQQRLAAFTLTQHNVLGEGGTWPLATQILLGYASREPIRVRAQMSGEAAQVREAAGKPCPDYVYANDQDYAYGLFMLDDRSRDYATKHIGRLPNLFDRTLIWGSLWDSVRFAELAPRDYLSVALRNIAQEADEALVQSVGGNAAYALHHYAGADARGQAAPHFEKLALDRMLNSSTQGLRIMWFRTLRSVAEAPLGLNELKDLLNGKSAIPDVRLRPLDRWTMVAALLAHGDPQASAIYQSEKQHDQTGDGQRYAYVAGAAKPDAATKKWYFDDYLHNPARQEDWIAQSLGAFNFWNQSTLTGPYLRPALDALPQIKQQRKIFFVLAWLNAFIQGQESPAADAEVHSWLASAPSDRDLKLKVLQVSDELDRIVTIRERFP
ncbi:MAG TPA: M1 family aminopeptidase [Bryobacteraceae bacterium]|jgi:aminopeptidase N|nr:M1 family aminopeptidase [Bryobacteraceae bacterium]